MHRLKKNFFIVLVKLQSALVVSPMNSETFVHNMKSVLILLTGSGFLGSTNLFGNAEICCYVENCNVL